MRCSPRLAAAYHPPHLGTSFCGHEYRQSGLPTSHLRDALQQMGRTRAGLLAGGIVAPRAVFLALAVIALAALIFAAQLSADSAGARSPAASTIRRTRRLQHLVVLHGVCARRPLRVRPFPLRGRRARQKRRDRRQRRHGASLCLGDCPVAFWREVGAQIRCAADAGSTLIGSSFDACYVGRIRATSMARRAVDRDPASASPAFGRPRDCRGMRGTGAGSCARPAGRVARHRGGGRSACRGLPLSHAATSHLCKSLPWQALARQGLCIDQIEIQICPKIIPTTFRYRK